MLYIVMNKVQIETMGKEWITHSQTEHTEFSILLWDF